MRIKKKKNKKKIKKRKQKTKIKKKLEKKKMLSNKKNKKMIWWHKNKDIKCNIETSKKENNKNQEARAIISVREKK